jgi:hypothetical protein
MIGGCMHEETVICLTDLQFVCIECPHCKTKVTLDMSRDFSLPDGRTVFAPTSCPGCRKAFDSALPENIDTLRRIYEAIPETLRASITFPKPRPGQQQIKTNTT